MRKKPFQYKTTIIRVSQLLWGLTKLYGNNLIGNSFIRKFVKNSYASQKNKSTRIRWLSPLIRQWIPVVFKGSVMNNVSLSASNLIINHKNNESYYHHTTLIRLLRFQVNIYPANYYYHDSIGSFIIRTACLVELLGIIPENSYYST